MTQYNHTTDKAGEPQTQNKAVYEWLFDIGMIAFLVGFTVWLIACQPIPV